MPQASWCCPVCATPISISSPTAFPYTKFPLAGTQSKAEMLARIAARVPETATGAWITGQGWNESRWGETAFPLATDLDPITGPDRPAIFWRSDMHSAVVNSAALRLAGHDSGHPKPARRHHRSRRGWQSQRLPPRSRREPGRAPHPRASAGRRRRRPGTRHGGPPPSWRHGHPCPTDERRR